MKDVYTSNFFFNPASPDSKFLVLNFESKLYASTVQVMT